MLTDVSQYQSFTARICQMDGISVEATFNNRPHRHCEFITCRQRLPRAKFETILSFHSIAIEE